MDKFKAGDRVRYVGNTEGKAQDPEAVGRVGTVAEKVYRNYVSLNYRVVWDGGYGDITLPFEYNLEPEVKTFDGIKKGDRVRFEAKKKDYSYSSDDLPTVYNGIQGTVERVSYETARVNWDIPEIGNRASFTDNLVVIDRPAPKRKTVTVEFDAPADENIENLVQQVTALSEVKYTIKAGN